MASFEEQVETACQDGTIVGVVLIATNASGSFTYQKAIGASDKPYRLDSPMKLQSAIKLITSIAALQCVERGLIGLDDDVGPHLPSLAQYKVLVDYPEGGDPVLEELARPITLRLLLTHSAGTGWGVDKAQVRKYRERNNTIHLFFTGKRIEDRYGCPLSHQPGTQWQYGAAHDWTGKLVEALTGTDLDSYIQANISSPLDIKTLTFWPSQKGITDQIPDAVVRKGSGPFKAVMFGGPPDDPNAPLVPFPEWDKEPQDDCPGGAGGVCSPSDYVKVLRTLLLNDGKVLGKASVDRMFMPSLNSDARKSLTEVWHAGFKAAAPGEYPADVALDWGLGAMLTLEDSPGWRGKGSLIWTGLPNIFWFVDRQNDLCGIFATQQLPGGDDRAKSLTTLWEKEMHRLASEARSRI